MVDTPFINDGADESLRKTVSLLNKIEAKTGSTTITGPVTVNNEVEVTNSTGNPIPVSGTVTANTGLTQPLTNTELRLSAVPVSLASVPSHPVTGPLTDTQLRAASVPVSQATAANLNATVVGSGSFTAAQATAANLNATVVGSGSFTAAQATASNLKAQAQLLNAAGSVVDYAMTGVAGTPATDVVSVQGISGGTVIPVSLASVPSHAVTGSGSFTAAQATASNLKAQAQILDSAGSLLTYGSTGVAGSPSSDVITVQGASAGTAVNTKILNSSGTAVTYAETGTYGSPSVDVLSVQNPQGVTATITTFTSTTASTSLVAVGSTRKALTVYNSGPGDLYISPTATCTTTNFQLKLSSGDFWECPASQVLLSHTGVFATSGTAYITNLI